MTKLLPTKELILDAMSQYQQRCTKSPTLLKATPEVHFRAGIEYLLEFIILKTMEPEQK
jgi:hypothetical protein